MRRALALLVALAASALLAGCSGGGLGGDAAVSLLPEADREPAPAVSVPALADGGRVDLADHRGTPVVLNFWASWCEPCMRETPALVAFSKERPGLDVVGLAVSDRPSDARRFAASEDVPYDLGVDRDAKVAGKFGVTGLPVTVIIDADGRVASTFFGEIDADQLDSFADQLGV
jgi:cytochrome c biogenesis protein CcmG/thiol:disulfide interchange protein DsbE